MRIPAFLLRFLRRRADRIMLRRPDFVIGNLDDPYLIRWWVIPRNRWFNIYLHEIRRSDDDRALHDHPWLNASIILQGGYFEHRIRAGGVEERLLRMAGDVAFRGPRAAHRLEVDRVLGSTITLFITGPIVRHWGFHCPQVGWRHWKDFTSEDSSSTIGRGCGEMDRPARRGGWRLPGFGQ